MTFKTVLSNKLRLAALSLVFSAAPFLAHSEEYLLGVQDRLRIYVSEWPALTGEVVVGPNGNISLPVVGQVPAVDISMADLSTRIAETLREKADLPALPDTSVDIVAYRPFYILGAVSSPGEYSYRPGMRVLNAMSIAGGLYRSERNSEWDIERVAIASQGELSVLTLSRMELEAEKIRFQAELADAQSFPETPADADAHLARSLEEQRPIFEGALKQRQQAKASLEASIASRQSEIRAITQQTESVGEKLKSTENELQQIRTLAKQGFAGPKLYTLERMQSDVIREREELEIIRLQAEQGLETLRRDLISLDETRSNGAMSGIQRVNARLREIDAQHRSLAEMLDGAAFYATGSVAEEQDNAPQLRFYIVRGEGDDVSESEVTETTRVLPGDIVKVVRIAQSQPTDGRPRSAAGTTTPGANLQ